MGYEHLRLSFDGHAATITLDRPPVNALNMALVRELGAAAAEIGASDARAVILTGAGKFFVAGADIGEMRDYSAQQATAFAREGQRVLAALEALPQPVIAAVNGFALGGGCELAMACDLILAGPRAVFGQPEVKLGVIPGFGGTQRLARLVGRQVARELCYTGRLVKAQEAAALGLALRVTDGDVVAAAGELADAIAANGPAAVGLAKRAINEGADLDLASGLAAEATLFGLCFATDDQTEGMSAFLEKRSVNFTGK